MVARNGGRTCRLIKKIRMCVRLALLALSWMLLSCLAPHVACSDGKTGGDGRGNDLLEMDPNPHLACSACEAVTYVIMAHLQSKKYETRATVKEPDQSGKLRTVPYMKSATHVETVVSTICNTADMSLLKKRQGWLGKSRYEFDEVPTYDHDLVVEPSLRRACLAITQGKRSNDLKRFLLSAIRSSQTSSVPAVICVQMLPVCKWKLARHGFLKAALEEAFLHDPSVVIRLAPFAVIFGSLPFVFWPMFVQSPPPRERPPPEDAKANPPPQEDKGKANPSPLLIDPTAPKESKRRSPGKGKKKRT
eukprot:TRINITY_DN16492_c0_g1_i1.p1 TRINITY_DN16492_c0_g1~~TRINITY_DN16492_c0_g1_i1.p1  ORF type:complete len:305 (+),score=42.61 TRINITY_DN16492_c0_g1_i1:53-967(+)